MWPRRSASPAFPPRRSTGASRSSASITSRKRRRRCRRWRGTRPIASWMRSPTCFPQAHPDLRSGNSPHRKTTPTLRTSNAGRLVYLQRAPHFADRGQWPGGRGNRRSILPIFSLAFPRQHQCALRNSEHVFPQLGNSRLTPATIGEFTRISRCSFGIRYEFFTPPSSNSTAIFPLDFNLATSQVALFIPGPCRPRLLAAQSRTRWSGPTTTIGRRESELPGDRRSNLCRPSHSMVTRAHMQHVLQRIDLHTSFFRS